MNYVIGKSDFHKDWFFEQVPHNEDLDNVTGNGRGRATTWTVSFNLPDATHGKATLRLAICGVGSRSIAATMNNQSIGNVTGLTYNATINRDGIGGYWGEHDLVFDASLMKAGEIQPAKKRWKELRRWIKIASCHKTRTVRPLPLRKSKRSGTT